VLIVASFNEVILSARLRISGGQDTDRTIKNCEVDRLHDVTARREFQRFPHEPHVGALHRQNDREG